jgi:nucleoside-diphosphate-sugar epimerase
MIYGNSRDHNMNKLVRVLDRLPVFPVFGPGTALMQPVYVGDLADGIVAAVEREATGEFNLAGDVPLTYNEILKTVAAALGRNVRLVHVNHGLAARIVSVLEPVPGFPIKHEQVMRLLEDKAFDITSSVAELDYRPRSFAEGIALQVAEYRSAST